MRDGSGEPSLGVLGASGLVGSAVIEVAASAGFGVHAFSRRVVDRKTVGIQWHRPGAAIASEQDWIVSIPIWSLFEWLPWLEACGARRIVVLSSTSVFAKRHSLDVADRVVAARFAESEQRLIDWATAKGMGLVLLRPTLIYGRGRDRNLSRMADFARRFRHVPVVGAARGLRQPVHVDDVAQACLAALRAPEAAGSAFVLSGAEVVAYREMARRVMAAVDVPPRLLRLPVLLGAMAGWVGMRLGFGVSPGIAYRMDQDQHFGHEDAAAVLGFKPRLFCPVAEDLLRGTRN